jgi:hypothetical protein
VTLTQLGDAFTDDPRDVLRELEKLDHNNRIHDFDGGWRIVEWAHTNAAHPSRQGEA